jgi:nitrogen-specific signal transduction histidine kinase
MSEWKFDNSLMATALNTVTDAVLVMNTDYQILYSNIAAQTIFSGIKDFFDKTHWMKEREVYDFKRNRKLEEKETPIGLALSNAVDAVEDLPRPTVRIEGHEDESFVYLSVYDSGMGVPESMRGKIFDPFFTSKALGKGTGHGLSISRNIMKNHGGDLFLDNLKTETCFTMKIPY